MRATKGNREYVIDEAQVKSYRDSGFDVKDEEGNVVAYGRGKTVPYETYMAAVKDKEALQNQVEELHRELERMNHLAEASGREQENIDKRSGKKAGE